MLTIYGIPNCDTMKKARVWLDARNAEYSFHDYKKRGIDADTLDRWIDAAGWEPILNRSGTTFRKLSDQEKADIDRDKAFVLMMAQPSLIKRPVVDGGGVFLIGFKPDEWAQHFG